jgi:hypothetical protein
MLGRLTDFLDIGRRMSVPDRLEASLYVMLLVGLHEAFLVRHGNLIDYPGSLEMGVWLVACVSLWCRGTAPFDLVCNALCVVAFYLLGEFVRILTAVAVMQYLLPSAWMAAR